MKRISFQAMKHPAQDLEFPDSCDIVVGRGDEAGPLRFTKLERRPGVYEVRANLSTLSRSHALLRVRPEGITVEDLRSTNGTYVQVPPARPCEAAVNVLLGSEVSLRVDGGRTRLAAPDSLHASTPEELASYVRGTLADQRCDVRTRERPPTRSPSTTSLPLSGGACHLVIEWSTANMAASEWVRDVVNLFNAKVADGGRPGFRFTAVSPERRQILERARRAARVSCTVLLIGPSGAGKDVLARDIHDHGPFAQGPFVPVNCGALPSTLFERELFGHERGAFTGAEARMAGLVAAADGGTLFLNEVGELSPDAQAKLLSFLDTKQYRPVGASASRPANVRVIAATNRDLDDAPAAVFRRDLFHRLNEYRINVRPPSAEDIAAMVRVVAPEIAASVGSAVGPEELETLVALAAARAWEGNCRAFQAALRTYFMDRDPGKTVEQNWHGVGPRVAPRREPLPSPSSMKLRRMLVHMRNLIYLGVARDEGTVAGIAKRLEITTAAVYLWLEKLPLAPDRVGDRELVEQVIAEERKALGPWLAWLTRLLDG